MQFLAGFACLFGGAMMGMNAVFIWLYLKDLAQRADIRDKLEASYRQRPDLEKKVIELSDKVNSMSIRISNK